MSELHPALADRADAVDALIDIGRDFHARGWSVGTSSNYSVVASRTPLELVVTASGFHKGKLTLADFVRVGADGTPTTPDQPKSSAETQLHVMAAEVCTLLGEPVGAVLHGHSVWATVLSDRFRDGITFAGYEMLKGLAGITTHESEWVLPVVPNTQDIASLAAELRAKIVGGDDSFRYGFVLAKHGLYTWGRDLGEAYRHFEVLEFLMECEGRRLSLG
ncbi:MAG: methylthioribulose 1-phosphate dehydratase [Planctomycetota bacterium]